MNLILIGIIIFVIIYLLLNAFAKQVQKNSSYPEKNSSLPVSILAVYFL